MSNKTQLQTNNTDLDALIARVNAAKDTASSLPDAGSSGSFESATVVIKPNSSMMLPGSGIGTLVYTSSSGEIISTPYNATSSEGFSFVAAKSTLCTFSGAEMPSETRITGGTLVFGGLGQVICSLDNSSVSIGIE